MNKIYKIVWNSALKTWVVASELAKSKNKNSSHKLLFSTLATVAVISFSPNAFSAWVNGAGAVGTPYATAQGTNSIAIGGATTAQATANGTNSIAIGNGASQAGNTTRDANNIAIGTKATNGNVYSGATAGFEGSQIAIGNTATTTTDGQIALGYNARAGGLNHSIAIGTNAAANGNSSISIGRDTFTSGSNSFALGAYARVYGQGSIAVGNDAVVGSSTASIAASIAIGDHSNISSTSSLALGVYANVGAGLTGAVALGSNSVARVATGVPFGIINGKDFTFAGGSPLVGSVVSVGSVGNERQIQNVAAGQISRTSTDAINGSQLYATNTILEQVTSDTAKALGTTVDPSSGGLVTPSYTITRNPSGSTTVVNNVKDALSGLTEAVMTPLNFTGDSGSSANKLGSTLAIVGDSNLTTTASQGQVAVALNKDLNLNSVTLGTTVINQTGVTADKVSVGTVVIDKTTNKISGVAAGTNTTDAVNVGQLTAATDKTDALGESTANNLGGGATYDPGTGAVSAPSYTIIKNPNGTTTIVNNVGEAISGLTEAVMTPLTFTGDSGSSVNKLGSTLAIVGDSNLTTTASQGQIAVALNKDLNLNSVTLGTTVINQMGVTADKVSVGTVVIDKTTNKISGVAAGTNTTDAVNVGQLTAATDKTDALGESTANNLGGGATYDPGTGAVSAPSYTIIKNPNGTTTIVNNVGEAISGLTEAVMTPLTFTGDSGSSVNKLGSTLAIVGDSNLTTTASQGQVAVALNKDLTGLNSILTTDGSSSTLLNGSGLVINGGGINGPSITTAGVNAGNKTITNVAAGVNDSDAVNLGQLNTAIGGVSGNTVWTLQTNGTNPATVLSGATVDIGVADPTDGNLIATKTGNNVTFALNQNLNLNSVTLGTTVINQTGVTADKVSVGTVVIDKTTNKITGVTAGTNTTDAVNVGQLTAATDKTDALGESTANNLGGGSTYDPGTGAVSAPSYTIIKNPSGSTTIVNNVGEAISGLTEAVMTPLTFTGDSGSSVNKLGSTLAIVGDSNLTTTASQGQIAVALNKDLDLNSVTLGTTVINQTGVTADKVSVGTVVIDKTTNKITGVAAGTNTTDAVNVGQLTAATDKTDALGESTANNLGGGSTYDPGTGAVSAPSYTIIKNPNGTTTIVNNVGEAISGLTEAVMTPLTFTGDSGSSVNKLGSTLAIVGDSNLTTTASQGQIAVALNKDLNLNSVTLGNTIINQTGVTADKVSVGTVVIDKTTNKITGLAAGTSDSDAVNLGQLNTAIGGVSGNTVWTLQTNGTNPATVLSGATVDIGVADPTDGNLIATKTGNNVAFALNQNLNLNSVTLGTTVINQTGITADKVSVGTVVIDKTTNKITGVAAGTNTTDAVNVGQLTAATDKTDALGESTANNLGGGSTYDPGTGAVSAPSYTIIKNPSGTTTIVNNVGEAISGLTEAVMTPLTFTGNSGSSVNKLGSTLAIVGDSNITTTASQGQIAVALNKDLNLNSVTLGSTVINQTGVTADKVSVGTVVIDKTTNKITGVAAGTNTTDAVNVGQLTSATNKTDALGESTANNLGGGSTYDPGTGAVSAPSYTIIKNPSGSTTIVNNVGEAISGLTEAVMTPLTFTGDSGSSVNKLGSTLAIVGDENITTTASQGQIAVTLSKDLTGLNSILTTDGSNSTLLNGSGLVINVGGINGPSITTAGVNAGNQTITNVAAGVNDTDAVNLSQLNSHMASATTEVKAKDGDKNISVTSALASDGHTIYAVGINRDLDVNSVTLTGLGGSSTHLTSDGLIFKDNNGITTGPSITINGIDAGDEKITNILAGEVSASSTDAINGSQLYDLGNNVTNIFGGNATYNGGQIIWTNIGGTGQNSINDAIQHINNLATNAGQGWSVTTDSGAASTSTVKPGDNVSITGDKNSGITVSNSGNNLTIGLSDKVNVGDKVSIDGTTGIINAGKVTIDGDKGTVNGLTNTTWDTNNYTSGQAATEDQLAQVAQQTGAQVAAAKTEVTQGNNIVVTQSRASDGHTIYNVATANDVNFNSITSGSLTVGTVTIDQSGINAGGEKVTNVAAGTVSSTSTDAINGSQLYATNQNISNYFGGGSTVDANGNTTAPTYNVGGGSYNNVGEALSSIDNKVNNFQNSLDQAFSYTNNRINKLEDKMSAGIAATAALEAAPYVSGKWTYAAGASYYNDQSALGVTLRRTADNGRWSLNGGVAGGTIGSPLFRVGISGVID